jgi:hypothetical protein
MWVFKLVNLDDIDERLLFDDDFIDSIYSKKEAARMNELNTGTKPNNYRIATRATLEAIAAERDELREQLANCQETRNKLDILAANEGRINKTLQEELEDARENIQQRYEMHDLQNQCAIRDKHEINLLREALGDPRRVKEIIEEALNATQ